LEGETIAVFVIVVHVVRYGMTGIMRKLLSTLFDLAHVACYSDFQNWRQHARTVISSFRRITSDFAGVVCQLSRMASCSIRPESSGFIQHVFNLRPALREFVF
jgi:hypothetical protein